jgi:hypothetical protein
MTSGKSEKSKKVEGQKLGLLIFECAMAVLYLGVGVLFLVTPYYSSALNGGIRTGLGAVLGIYGMFRVFRAIRKITLMYK